MSEATLRVYEWQNDEYMLIDWYNTLVTSGDMYVTFGNDMRYMSNFLAYFKAPRTLAYASDEKGWTFAFWLEPAMSGAFFGMWVRADKRQSPSSLRAMKLAMDESFKFATVLVSITKQEVVAGELEKIGATRHTPDLPGLWDGSSVAVYSITRDAWETKYGKRRQE